MPQVPQGAAPPERSYWALVRLLAEGNIEVEAKLVRRVLAEVERDRSQLDTDVEAARERRRLLHASGSVLDLEVSCEVAEEGYRMMRESARKSRAEAEAREAKAHAIWLTLQDRLEGAREAEQKLKDLVPPELAEQLEARRDLLTGVRAHLDVARQRGLCIEHLEAAQEQAELAWREVRAAIW